MAQARRPAIEEPRRLTWAEIDDVLSAMPRLRAASQEISLQLQAEVKTYIRLVLQDEKICPQGIPLLKQLLREVCLNARIDPGSTVGLTAAEAIGGPLIQTTLNSFHRSGSAKNISGDIGTVKEIFNITKSRKVKTCDVHFRRKDLSFAEVMNQQKVLVGTTMQDIIDRIEYKQYKSENNEAAYQLPWWITTYARLRNLSAENLYVQNNDYYMLITFDRNKMYSFNLTTWNIANLYSAKTDAIQCIPSPNDMAQMCIFCQRDNIINVPRVDEESKRGGKRGSKKKLEHLVNVSTNSKLTDDSKDMLTYIYLKNFVADAFPNDTLQNISGITSVLPIRQRVWDYQTKIEKLVDYVGDDAELASKFKAECKIADADFKSAWIIWIDPIKIVSGHDGFSGMPLIKFRDLFESIGATLLYHPYDLDYEENTAPDVPSEFSLHNRMFIIKPRSDISMSPSDIVDTKLELCEDERYYKYVKYFTRTRKLNVAEVKSARTGLDQKFNTDNVWRLEINAEGKVSDSELSGIRKLLSVCFEEYADQKWGVIREEKDYFIVSIPRFYDTERLNPIEIMKYLTDFEKIDNDEIPTMPFIRAYFYHYAECRGANLSKLLAHPSVDPNRTISSNAHEIQEILGVETARNFLLRELHTAITYSGAIIDPRHLCLVVDYMTSTGTLLPITSRSVARQDIGAFTRATFEEPVKAFIESATGREEDALSASFRISLGELIKQGTNFSRTELDEEKIQQAHTFREQHEPPPGDVQALVDVIDNTDINAFGVNDNNAQPIQQININQTITWGADREQQKIDNERRRGGNNKLCPKGPLPEIKTVAEENKYLTDLFADIKETKDLPKIPNIPPNGVIVAPDCPILRVETPLEMTRRQITPVLRADQFYTIDLNALNSYALLPAKHGYNPV